MVALEVTAFCIPDGRSVSVEENVRSEGTLADSLDAARSWYEHEGKCWPGRSAM